MEVVPRKEVGGVQQLIAHLPRELLHDALQVLGAERRDGLLEAERDFALPDGHLQPTATKQTQVHEPSSALRDFTACKG